MADRCCDRTEAVVVPQINIAVELRQRWLSSSPRPGSLPSSHYHWFFSPSPHHFYSHNWVFQASPPSPFLFPDSFTLSFKTSLALSRLCDFASLNPSTYKVQSFIFPIPVLLEEWLAQESCPCCLFSSSQIKIKHRQTFLVSNGLFSVRKEEYRWLCDL